MKNFFLFTVIVVLIAITQNVFAAINNERVLTGTIKGAYVTFKDNVKDGSYNEVYIKSGYGDSNGKYFEIASDITYELTSIIGDDFYYIYIDDSAASYPVLDSSSAFTHSTTEPSWSDAKQGWYNDNNRCIGVVWVVDNASNDYIAEFGNISGETYKFLDYYSLPAIMTDQNVTASGWHTVSNADEKTPVNAISVHFYAMAMGGPSSIFKSMGIVPAESPTPTYAYAIVNSSYNGTCYLLEPLEMQRGWSRDIKWSCTYSAGTPILITIKVVGYKIER